MAANNPYERLLRADTAQAMRQSMQQAADLNPDTEAKLQGLARQYGVPVDAVRLEQPAMERRAKIDAIDYDRLAREAPTRKFRSTTTSVRRCGRLASST